MSSINTYELYHQNSINKAIHSVCIPMITLTSMNYLNNMFLCTFKNKYGYNLEINARSIAMIIYNFYYLNISWSAYFSMMTYLNIMTYVSDYWQQYDKHWLANSTKVFIFSWGMQFLGHFIEGSRPALTDSLSSSIFQAPMFSLNYFIPFLEN